MTCGQRCSIARIKFHPVCFEWDTFGPTTMWFRGILDEVRISNIKRTADWIETSYNNESVPGTFLHSVFTPITGTPKQPPR